MWQKEKGKWHLLLNHSADLQDGRFLQTACGNQIQVKRKSQNVFALGENCSVCMGVWHIVFTSVAEAKTTLKTTTNLDVLNRSLELTKSISLMNAIVSRINKIKKAGVK